MKPDKLTIHDLFQRERRYVVPLYQRAYVWTLQDQWEPLWEDIERKAEACLVSPNHTPDRSHFLGAIVLNVSRIVGAGVARSEVIDGQQRLTTLQIFIAALRDVATAMQSSYTARLRRLTINEDEKRGSEGSFKVWPTNADRVTFRQVMSAGTPDALGRLFSSTDTLPRMAQAYAYFFNQITAFVNANSDGPEATDERVFALLQALRTALQVVVIELEDGDDPQIIFETLNARGQPLLPSDLIRNYLFLSATNDPALDADDLYNSFWKPFDDRRTNEPVNGDNRFWHIEERQGRLTRPRIDLFLFHYLVMQTESDFTIGGLFREFRDWRDEQTSPIEVLLADLQRYGAIFSTLIEPLGNDRVAHLARKLKALDTSTVYPFLLYILALSPERLSPSDLDQLLTDLESWLVRRFICQLTNKNYNRFFVSLLSKVKNAPADINLSDVVRDELCRGREVTTVWPTNRTFLRAWLNKPVYAKSRPDRSGMILKAIEQQSRTARNEAVTIPERLSVEHLLPQRGSRLDYPLHCEQFLLGDETPDQCRERLLHTIGNLTLLTNELNASASNGPFPAKVQKIVADSDLRLNAWLRKQAPSTWTEELIIKRGEQLFTKAIQIWPMPLEDDEETDSDLAPAEIKESSGWKITDQASLNAKRRELIASISEELGANFVADTVSKYHATDGTKRLTIAVSKRYENRSSNPYWYAFHPDWLEYLQASPEGYFVLGMMDRLEAYVLPLHVLQPLLSSLNTTVRPGTGKQHWHIHIVEQGDGLALLLPKLDTALSITEYRVKTLVGDPA